MVARSIDRVSRQTQREVNDRIRRQTRMNVEYYEKHRDEITERLAELEEEWDVERMLETRSAGITLFGLMMGILGRRRWLLLPLVIQGFFMQHAIQGWCPPLPALRGDFGDSTGEPAEAIVKMFD